MTKVVSVSAMASPSSSTTTSTLVLPHELHEPRGLFVYSTTGCKYCRQAKLILEEMGYEYGGASVLDMEEEEVKSLAAMCAATSMPQIFIGTERIGGCDSLIEARDSGALVAALEAVGVSPSRTPAPLSVSGGGGSGGTGDGAALALHIQGSPVLNVLRSPPPPPADGKPLDVLAIAAEMQMRALEVCGVAWRGVA